MRGLDPAVRAAYLSLLPNQLSEIEAGKLDWKLVRQPSPHSVVSTAWADGRIIGMMTYMAVRVRLGDAEILAHQGMDTVVDPAARGKGVFLNLVKNFYESTESALLYGLPNLNASPGYFKYLGWKYMGTPPFLIKPLRAGYFLRRLWADAPDFRVAFPKRRAGELIAQFSDDATSMWRRFSRDIACAVDRSARFLNWRLFEHPSAAYRTFAAPSAFVSTRLAEKHGGRIGYVMEAIGDESVRDTLQTAVHDLAEHGAEVVLAWCFPWSPNYRAYRANGFLPLPDRLRPIRFNFGGRALKGSAVAAETPRSWYLSYLDSDTV